MDNRAWVGIDPASLWSGGCGIAQFEPHRPRPPADVEPAPVLPESVIGYRAWSLPNSAQLTGTGFGASIAWVPGVNKAYCAKLLKPHGGHQVPALRCGCGIYALARFDNNSAYWNTAEIFGAIEAWSREDEPGSDDAGSFIVQPPGFRSRFAKIVLLALPGGPDDAVVRALAKEYGADVCKLKHLEDAAKEHGNLLSDELLEWAKPEPLDSAWSNFLTQINVAMVANSLSVAEATRQLQRFRKAFQQSRPLQDKTNVTVISTAQDPPAPHVKQHLKTVGPPSLGKWHKGDTVMDRKGTLWTCVKKGTPGTWDLALQI